MINLQTGEVTLFHSNFSIHPLLRKEDIEKKIPECITFIYNVESGYRHYYLWGDIEKDDFIYLHLEFNPQNQLEKIFIFPQCHGKISDPRPDTLTIEIASPIVQKWYQQYFREEKEYYPWGEVWLIKGLDPIYSPSSVLFKYYNAK